MATSSAAAHRCLSPPLSVAIAIDMGDSLKPVMLSFEVSPSPMQLRLLKELGQIAWDAKCWKCDTKDLKRFRKALDTARYIASNSVFNAMIKPHLGSVRSAPTASLEPTQKEHLKPQVSDFVSRHKRAFSRQGTPLVDQKEHFAAPRSEHGLPLIREEDESSAEDHASMRPSTWSESPDRQAQHGEHGEEAIQEDAYDELSDTDSEDGDCAEDGDSAEDLAIRPNTNPEGVHEAPGTTDGTSGTTSNPSSPGQAILASLINIAAGDASPPASANLMSISFPQSRLLQALLTDGEDAAPVTSHASQQHDDTEHQKKAEVLKSSPDGAGTSSSCSRLITELPLCTSQSFTDAKLVKVVLDIDHQNDGEQEPPVTFPRPPCKHGELQDPVSPKTPQSVLGEVQDDDDDDGSDDGEATLQPVRSRKFHPGSPWQPWRPSLVHPGVVSDAKNQAPANDHVMSGDCQFNEVASALSAMPPGTKPSRSSWNRSAMMNRFRSKDSSEHEIPHKALGASAA